MAKNDIIRGAKPEDYPSFRRMEEKAWAGIGIDVISEDMFLTWLKVFPEGLRVAVKDGEICGHIYGQICDFDPFDENDNRDLYTMTDNMYTTRTHNPNGNCLYLFSLSAIYPGAGRELIKSYGYILEKYNKSYCAGAVRMPGLSRYIKKKKIRKITYNIVDQYARLVYDTINKKRRGKQKFFDPVLSIYLSIKGVEYVRVIKDFFTDKESYNWGCVICYKHSK